MPSRQIPSPHALGQHLVELLQLPKRCRRIVLTVDISEVPLVEVTFFPDVDLAQLQDVPAALTKRFRLFDVDESPAAAGPGAAG